MNGSGCVRKAYPGRFAHNLIENGRSDTDSGLLYPAWYRFFVYGDAVRNSDSECMCEDRTDLGAIKKVPGRCVGQTAGEQTCHRGTGTGDAT